LDLSAPVRQLVGQGKLTVGHGKLLAGVTDDQRQLELAERVVSQGLSVRNLERLLEASPTTPEPEKLASSAHLRDLEQTLSRQLGMKVQVKWSPQRGRGKLVIFYNLDQFDDLKQRLGVDTD
jgi:ParB family chromosome partitioning protein